MKKVYSVVLSMAVLLVFGVGTVFAQTTSELTTTKLQSMIESLQLEIQTLQNEIKSESDENKAEFTQESEYTERPDLVISGAEIYEMSNCSYTSYDGIACGAGYKYEFRLTLKNRGNENFVTNNGLEVQHNLADTEKGELTGYQTVSPNSGSQILVPAGESKAISFEAILEEEALEQVTFTVNDPERPNKRFVKIISESNYDNNSRTFSFDDILKANYQPISEENKAILSNNQSTEGSAEQTYVDENQADEGKQTQDEATGIQEGNKRGGQVNAEDAVSDTPAPGTVRVLAQVNSCDLQTATPTCELAIEEVLAYGMSTPIMSGDTELTVSVEGQADAELETVDTKTAMTLNSLQPRPSDADGPVWELLKLEESDSKTKIDEGNSILPEQAAGQARIARQLDQGDRGPDVRQLQELLAANNEIYPEGLVTGYYGPLTAQAVSRLQQRSGLPSVGRVGPRTLDQVNSLLTDGAGQSGVIPPELLQAPGLNGRRGNVSTSSSVTSSASSTVFLRYSVPRSLDVVTDGDRIGRELEIMFSGDYNLYSKIYRKADEDRYTEKQLMHSGTVSDSRLDDLQGLLADSGFYDYPTMVPQFEGRPKIDGPSGTISIMARPDTQASIKEVKYKEGARGGSYPSDFKGVERNLSSLIRDISARSAQSEAERK